MSDTLIIIEVFETLFLLYIMSKKPRYTKHLNNEKVCKNSKEQEFVGFCKVSIFKKKNEKNSQTHFDKKGITYFILIKMFQINFKILKGLSKILQRNFAYIFYFFSLYIVSYLSLIVNV